MLSSCQKSQYTQDYTKTNKKFSRVYLLRGWLVFVYLRFTVDEFLSQYLANVLSIDVCLYRSSSKTDLLWMLLQRTFDYHDLRLETRKTHLHSHGLSTHVQSYDVVRWMFPYNFWLAKNYFGLGAWCGRVLSKIDHQHRRQVTLLCLLDSSGSIVLFLAILRTQIVTVLN